MYIALIILKPAFSPDDNIVIMSGIAIVLTSSKPNGFICCIFIVLFIILLLVVLLLLIVWIIVVGIVVVGVCVWAHLEFFKCLFNDDLCINVNLHVLQIKLCIVFESTKKLIISSVVFCTMHYILKMNF